MPHAHAAAVVDRLLRRLASDARRLELPPHIDDDLEHVGRTLSRLQDVLVSLEARSGAQEWMGEIKQVAYDVEDLLDEFEVEDHSSIKSQTSGCISEAAPLCRACSFLLLSPSTNRMKTIRRRLDFSEKDSIIFSSMQYSCPDVEKFDNGVFDTSAIVGRDNDKAKIKDMLLQSNEEKLSVIPIVGLVGLGKTTLARLIFLDQEEGLNFDCRIWIFLNRKLDLIKVASDIISQCNHKEGNLLDVHTDIEIQGNLQLLKNSLQEALREKRCLIVLDDLSSTDKSQLDELKEMLKGTNECVKVLVTTSSEITAELVHTIPPYKLRPLSEDDSWTIFSQKAFGNSNSNNAHLLEVGKEIMKRCEGVPLLTHFLSSIVHNQDTDMWLAAKDEEIWKLERRLATKVELFSPLYRIYYEFPSITKLCFLYLSIFPKGSAIDKEKLIRQWIALEIIGSKHDSFPPYVHGEMCIQDLLSTHFLQVQNMHSIQTLPSSMSRLTNLELLDLSKTFLKELPSFIGNFQNLKYLNMHGCDKLQNLPSSLGHLQRLQHLRLSCCNVIAELPDSMCNLHDLRILDISKCTELQHLPPLFGNLVNLEDVRLSSCFNLKQLPESFGNLYFLRFLDLSSCYELQQLPDSFTNLDKLEVLLLRRCCRLQNLPPSFASIKYLRILDLAGCEALHVSTEMLTTNLEHLNLQRCLSLQIQPYYFENFNKLKFLNLSQCLPTSDCLKTVSYLFNLEYLKLSENFLDIPISFLMLQKLHTLDLTDCAPIHQSSNVHQIWPDIIGKITGLRFVLTKDPVLVASLPEPIRCSVGYDEQSPINTDELVISDTTGDSRGLSIAKMLNLQNRLELRFLKLEWVLTSQSAADELIEYVNEEEVLEKLQPNQTLEQFELVRYMGCAFPTWMMNTPMTSLPYLVNLRLFHLHNCIALPPLGCLKNLRYLHIKDMPNLLYLEMGLSGGPEFFGKLTHLKLETLNLKELPILLSASKENPCFMFPALEELSILSCSNLIFKPSMPKCAKYVIKESNMVLQCGQLLGPLSSPSPAKIEISGCIIPSDLLQWFKSMETPEEVVIDGEALTSFETLEIQGTQELSGSMIPTESDGAPKYTVIDSSRTVKASPRFGTTSEQSVGPISSSKVSMASKEILSTLHRLDKSEMSAQMRGDVFLNLSLRQVRKATRNFSPLLKLGEGGIWAVYRAVLPDNLIVTIRRAKKGHIQEAKCLMKVKLLTEISHWSLVRFLGFIDKGNECIRITEYVPNGTLRQHLHDQHKRILDFNQRIVIALDVAIALTYLHLCFGQAVICYNLKTSNILLTESYRAKVCCSELSGIGHVMALTGTVGYIDPEYFQTSELTAKSDVYSFGILLLEILSSHGPQDWNVLMNHQQSSVVQWALEKFYDDLMNEILDYRMEDRVAGEVLRDWLSLALSCVASRGNDRPSIEVVGERLWKIWKDHRRNIGEQHEYEGSWDEFVKQEGILRHEKSVLKKNWAPSATEEEWFGYIKQIELVQEGCSVTQDKEHLLRSRSASLGDSNTTVSPR
ncbi:probable leucine-rich repeat receptor-like protein kinase At1g35710 isoform X2 [Setaria italica]|uniref:probable leucine-rich repeat receptor-like protein kinase At1g35710 isoform X2 n=1 Tax=Setaria italica TaxID=4555 RepID=UPI000BE5098F|nr:probable leucine-rich repeat receptor-like protein kinase At1g35710 isoform X2 [Setaria italica]